MRRLIIPTLIFLLIVSPVLGVVEYEKGGYDVEISKNDTLIRFKPVATKDITINDVQKSRKGNEETFAKRINGWDVKYTDDGTKIKEEIIVPPQPGATKDITLTFELDFEDLYYYEYENEIYFYNNEGTQYKILEPVAIQGGREIKLPYSFDGFLYNIVVEAGILRMGAIIDPTIVYYGFNGTLDTSFWHVHVASCPGTMTCSATGSAGSMIIVDKMKGSGSGAGVGNVTVYANETDAKDFSDRTYNNITFDTQIWINDSVDVSACAERLVFKDLAGTVITIHDFGLACTQDYLMKYNISVVIDHVADTATVYNASSVLTADVALSSLNQYYLGFESSATSNGATTTTGGINTWNIWNISYDNNVRSPVPIEKLYNGLAAWWKFNTFNTTDNTTPEEIAYYNDLIAYNIPEYQNADEPHDGLNWATQPPVDLYDNDYSTTEQASAGGAGHYFNYTIPWWANDTTSYIKYGAANVSDLLDNVSITVPAQCWNYSGEDKIFFYANSLNDGGNKGNALYCRNTSGLWDQLNYTYTACANCHRIAEYSMFWDDKISNIENGAYHFDGTNYLNRSNIEPLGNNWSIETYLTPEIDGNQQDFLDLKPVGSHKNRIIYRLLGLGNLSVFMQDKSGTAIYKSYLTNVVQTGDPVHFVTTWDGTNLLLYIDGVNQSVTKDFDGAVSMNSTPGYNMLVGRNWDGVYYNGTIDYIKFYDRVLAPWEVAEHATYLENYTGTWINLTFKYLANDTVANDINISYEMIQDSTASNKTTESGEGFFNVSDEDMTIRYSATGFDFMNRIISITPNTINNATLYLSDTADTTDVTISVGDELSNRLPYAQVDIKKYDITTNNYTEYETVITDSNGQGIAHLILNEEFYTFTVSLNGTTLLTTSPQYVISDSITLIVDTAATSGEYAIALINSRGNLTYNNETYEFMFNYTGGADNGACLYVYRLSGTTENLVNSSCNTGASGSIVANIANTTAADNRTYHAVAKIHFGSEDQYSLYHTFDTGRGILGLLGIFLSIFIIIIGVFIGIDYPLAAVGGVPIMLASLKLIGLLTIEWHTVAGIAIAAVVVIWLVRDKT